MSIVSPVSSHGKVLNESPPASLLKNMNIQSPVKLSPIKLSIKSLLFESCSNNISNETLKKYQDKKRNDVKHNFLIYYEPNHFIVQKKKNANANAKKMIETKKRANNVLTLEEVKQIHEKRCATDSTFHNFMVKSQTKKRVKYY